MTTVETVTSKHHAPETVALPEAELNMRRIVLWTIPSPEIDDLIQTVEGRVTVPLEKPQWTLAIMETSRVRADTQNQLGISLKIYPEAVIKGGRLYYTFEPQPGLRRPGYEPNTILPHDQAWDTIFPQSRPLRVFAKLIQESTPAETTQSSNHLPTWAQVKPLLEIGQQFYQEDLLSGSIRIEKYQGWPVVIFPDPKDLQRFQPYTSYRAPDATVAISFIATPSTTPKPGPTLENCPFVAVVEGCPPQVIDQHLNSQLAFAQAIAPYEASPILVTRDTLDLEAYLLSVIKDHILEQLIRETHPVPSNWAETNVVRQTMTRKQRELFETIGKRRVKTRFFIGDHPDRLRLGPDYQEKIRSWFTEVMNQAYQTLDRIGSLSGASELQRVKANYFSFSPLDQWEEAADRLVDWEGLEPFHRSYRLPPLGEVTEQEVTFPEQRAVVEPNHVLEIPEGEGEEIIQAEMGTESSLESHRGLQESSPGSSGAATAAEPENSPPPTPSG